MIDEVQVYFLNKFCFRVISKSLFMVLRAWEIMLCILTMMKKERALKGK